MNKSIPKLPSLSHFSSREKWEEACWKIILKSREFLDSFTTPNERRNVVLRAAALGGLHSKKSYQQIAEEIGLSPQTISSARRTFEGNGYKSYRERGKLERKKKTYSPDIIPKKRKPSGRPIRTKYGIIHVP